MKTTTRFKFGFGFGILITFWIKAIWNHNLETMAVLGVITFFLFLGQFVYEDLR